MKKVKPMLLTYQEGINQEPGWIAEPKFNGHRLLLGDNYSYTRHGTITTHIYPELLLSGYNALLDGELIAPGTTSPDNFEGAMSRFHGNKEQPIQYMAFDILTYNNQSVMSQPIEERKGLLTELLSKLDSPYIHLVPYVLDEANAFFDVIKEKNMEGIVIKRSGSKYTPNRRSDNWRKIIAWRYADFIVTKVTRGPLTAQLHNAEGNYMGSVSIGFTKEVREGLYSRTVPFPCKVKFRGWTNSGKLSLPQIVELI